jgi:AmmeMemoRadiSam system protein B/AmmeMemoRadiSam system protein A
MTAPRTRSSPGGRRPAAVAGAFYPARPDALTTEVEGLLAAVPEPSGPPPKAIIAPHAGYVYSGPTAAAVYARLRPLRGKVTRVVLLGPVHRVPVRGLALSSAADWETPLGPVPLDTAAAESLSDLPQVVVEDRAHAAEHSLEVHLPFLRAVLGDGFALLPLAVGDARPEEVAEVLDRLWGGPETVVVVSTDLSHFLDYDACRAADARTVATIEGLRYRDLRPGDACGRLPVAGLLKLAAAKGLRIETVDVRNSGDTAGGRDRVVGYGAWALYAAQDPTAAGDDDGSGGGDDGDGGDAGVPEDTDALLAAHGPALLARAVAAIRHGLEHGGPPRISPDTLPAPLRRPGAVFVTLKAGGALRGCIGSAQAWRPLGADLADNAWRAAFRDPRFPALTAGEMPGLYVSVSLLTPPGPMTFTDEADLLRQIRPGVDGLLLEDGQRRGLFLPMVWEQLPEPPDFLAHLKRKAGLPADHWSATLTVSRFETRGVAATLGPDGGLAGGYSS